MEYKVPEWLKEDPEYMAYFGSRGRRVRITEFREFIQKCGGRPKSVKLIKYELSRDGRSEGNYEYNPDDGTMLVTWDGKEGNLVGLVMGDSKKKQKAKLEDEDTEEELTTSEYLEKNPHLFREVVEKVGRTGRIPKWWEEDKR